MNPLHKSCSANDFLNFECSTNPLRGQRTLFECRLRGIMLPAISRARGSFREGLASSFPFASLEFQGEGAASPRGVRGPRRFRHRDTRNVILSVRSSRIQKTLRLLVPPGNAICPRKATLEVSVLGARVATLVASGDVHHDADCAHVLADCREQAHRNVPRSAGSSPAVTRGETCLSCVHGLGSNSKKKAEQACRVLLVVGDGRPPPCMAGRRPTN